MKESKWGCAAALHAEEEKRGNGGGGGPAETACGGDRGGRVQLTCAR
jgi:hypothetical protein